MRSPRSPASSPAENTHACTHTHTCTHAHTHACTHTHACMHAHTHTHTHTPVSYTQLTLPTKVNVYISVVAVSLKKNFFKQKTAYEICYRLVGSEMCIRDRFSVCAPGKAHLSQMLPQCCLALKEFSVGVTDSDTFLSLEGRSQSTSSLYTSILHAITGVMSLALHLYTD